MFRISWFQVVGCSLNVSGHDRPLVLQEELLPPCGRCCVIQGLRRSWASFGATCAIPGNWYKTIHFIHGMFFSPPKKGGCSLHSFPLGQTHLASLNISMVLLKLNIGFAFVCSGRSIWSHLVKHLLQANHANTEKKQTLTQFTWHLDTPSYPQLHKHTHACKFIWESDY